MSKRGTDKSADLLCSFCGKSQGEVKKLIAGPGVYICDECIELCNDIIAEEHEREEAARGLNMALLAPQHGHFQSSGKSSNLVSLGILPFLSPWAGS